MATAQVLLQLSNQVSHLARPGSLWRPLTYMFHFSVQPGFQPTLIKSERFQVGLVTGEDLLASRDPVGCQLKSLDQLKAWQQSLPLRSYCVAYRYPSYSPAELYQLIYVNPPKGFKTVNSLGSGPQRPDRLSDDLWGHYYNHRWVDELTATELAELRNQA